MLAFSEGEFTQRVTRLRGCMAQAHVRVALITRPENIFYLTGYRAAHIAARTSELHAVVVPMDGPPRLICRSLEAETVTGQWTPSPCLLDDGEDPYLSLFEIIVGYQGQSDPIGLEERWLRVSQLRQVAKAFPRAQLVDLSGEIEGIMGNPSTAEKACVRAAARIADVGMSAGLEAVAPGLYPYEVIGRIHEAMYSAGQSDFDRSLVALWSGPRGGRMHDTLTTEQMHQGDLVTIEVMGVDRHYRAGSQTTVYLGETVPDEVAQSHDLVVRMHNAAVQAVRSGVTGAAVFRAASDLYEAATGRPYYRRVGGSMGLTQFTFDLVNNNLSRLPTGMALLIQTLVDAPALIACASTVEVTETGADFLTAPRMALTARR